MLKEFEAVVWIPNFRIFAIQLDEIEIENKHLGDPYVMEGVGCVCLDDSCDDKWPTQALWGMNSAGNPYECWFMQKQETGWRVLPWQY